MAVPTPPTSRDVARLAGVSQATVSYALTGRGTISAATREHVLRVAEWTESLRDLVTSLFETNLSLQDMRLNEVMRKLAAWAAIIAVPTAVTGWFGQNIPYPGYTTRSGLWLSIALIVIACSALYVAFRRRGWL